MSDVRWWGVSLAEVVDFGKFSFFLSRSWKGAAEGIFVSGVDSVRVVSQKRVDPCVGGHPLGRCR